MLTAKRVRFWYRVHKWTSLSCTAFLLMSCMTGLFLIFGDELSDFVHPRDHAVRVPAGTPVFSLDRMIAESEQRYLGQRVISMGFNDDQSRVVMTMARTLDPAPGQSHALVFDGHTGQMLQDRLRKQKHKRDALDVLTDAVYDLHVSIYAGLPGELFLGCMAILFIVALVSGAVVYGPFMRRLKFGTIRSGKANRVKWFDLHNLLGIVTVSWALVVGATGAMNTLEGPLFDLWRADTMPRLLIPYRGMPAPMKFSSVDAAIRKTQEALPGMNIRSVVFPSPKFGRPRDYLIWTRGKTPLTSKLFTPVLIDAGTGQLMAAKGLPWYLRVLEVSRPLHFGDYGGMPLKIIWALFDVALIFVLISGLYLWLSRHRTPVEDELDRLVKLEEISVETPNTRVLAR